MIKCPVQGKLKPKHRGPTVVVANVAGDIYRVQELHQEGSTQGLVDLHISQIRLWHCPNLDVDDGDVDSDDSELSEPTA